MGLDMDFVVGEVLHQHNSSVSIFHGTYYIQLYNLQVADASTNGLKDVVLKRFCIQGSSYRATGAK